MALFGRKKQTEEVKPTQAKKAVNPDDIWNTPLKKSSGNLTVEIKESKYDEPTAEAVASDSIDPETIRKKMELLEKELEIQKNKPVKTYSDYDTNPIAEDEVETAQDRFEEQYKIEHERYLESHVQDIDSANSQGVEKKISDMVDETERRAQAVKEKNYGIEQVGADEVSSKLAQLNDPKDVTKDENFKNIEAVSDEAMNGAEEYIKNTLDTRVAVDEYDEIESVSAEDVEQKTQEFMKKYGN